MNITAFSMYCGLMLSVSAFSIDILLPSFLDIGEGLNVSMESVQLTIPVYMLALGLANPLYGILADRIGRRRGIFIGLSIYALGTLICVLSPGIGSLLAGRFLQGFGAASAPVICRAMIRDKFSGVELAQTMAVASMFFALGPLLAPLLGYLAFTVAGWRAVFILLMGLSVLMLVLTSLQQETLPLDKRRAHGWQSVSGDLYAIFGHRQSRRYILLSCAATGIILTFLSHAPLIYANLGVDSGGFAVMFAMTSVGIVIGQIINHRLLSIVSAHRAASYAAIMVAAIALAILLVAFTNRLSGTVFTALMFMFNMCYLIIFSNLVSLTLEPHGERAGMASAMFGFCSYIGGSLLSAAIAFFTDQETVRWAFFFSLLATSLPIGLFYIYQGESKSAERA